jgi:hypothetical protein
VDSDGRRLFAYVKGCFSGTGAPGRAYSRENEWLKEGQGHSVLADGLQLPTAHDHRKLRGDRGYQSWDIKGEALGLEFLHLSPFCQGNRSFEKASPRFLRQGVFISSYPPCGPPCQWAQTSPLAFGQRKIKGEALG